MHRTTSAGRQPAPEDNISAEQDDSWALLTRHKMHDIESICKRGPAPPWHALQVRATPPLDAATGKPCAEAAGLHTGAAPVHRWRGHTRAGRCRCRARSRRGGPALTGRIGGDAVVSESAKTHGFRRKAEIYETYENFAVSLVAQWTCRACSPTSSSTRRQTYHMRRNSLSLPPPPLLVTSRRSFRIATLVSRAARSRFRAMTSDCSFMSRRVTATVVG